MWDKREENTASTGSHSGPGTTQIGKSLKLKADIRGADDLFIDGEVIGSIELDGKNLTIGPNGRVEADVLAQSVTISGQLQGNVRASDSIELRKTGTFLGDMVTSRIIIEEGAVFRGSVDIVKPGQENEAVDKKPAVGESKPPARETKPVAKKTGAG
jgi:cytoskeletal protein CcmA (bactofilin family)